MSVSDAVKDDTIKDDMAIEAVGRKAQIALEGLGGAFDAEMSKVLTAVFAKIDGGGEITPNFALQTILHLYSIERTRTRLQKMSDRGIKASARTAHMR